VGFFLVLLRASLEYVPRLAQPDAQRALGLAEFLHYGLLLPIVI
jgi:hypothetical protein